MSCCNHSFDERWIGSSSVDPAFSKIVSSDKECSLESEIVKSIQQLVGIDVGTVVIRKSHYVSLHTIINVAAICDTSKQRSRIADGGCSNRSCIRVTSTEVELAIRICTIFFSYTAIACRTAT